MAIFSSKSATAAQHLTPLALRARWLENARLASIMTTAPGCATGRPLSTSDASAALRWGAASQDSTTTRPRYDVVVRFASVLSAGRHALASVTCSIKHLPVCCVCAWPCCGVIDWPCVDSAMEGAARIPVPLVQLQEAVRSDTSTTRPSVMVLATKTLARPVRLGI